VYISDVSNYCHATRACRFQEVPDKGDDLHSGTAKELHARCLEREGERERERRAGKSSLRRWW
jgi:hypothetical protein